MASFIRISKKIMEFNICLMAVKLHMCISRLPASAVQIPPTRQCLR